MIKQDTYVVRRIDGATHMYFSCGVGRDYASPSGGWQDERGKALQFARHKDAEDFLSTFLRHEAPFCEVILCNPL